MEDWWVYQLHNAQAALEAVLAIDRTFTPDEVTGLGVCSRQGPDERDHLYIAICSKNPPQGRIHGVDEILSRYGVPSSLTHDDLDEPRGRQWVASGPSGCCSCSTLERSASTSWWCRPGDTRLGDMGVLTVQSSLGD